MCVCTSSSLSWRVCSRPASVRERELPESGEQILGGREGGERGREGGRGREREGEGGTEEERERGREGEREQEWRGEGGREGGRENKERYAQNAGRIEAG